MEERIIKLEQQLQQMTKVIIAIILLQDIFTQMKLRKEFPTLDEILKKSGI